MLFGEVVFGEFENDGEKSEDFGCEVQRAVGEVLNFWLKLVQVGVKGFVGVGWDEFGNVDGLDVVEDVGAHYFLFVCCTVSEIVAIREVAAIFWVALLFEWEIEVCLTNVILTVYFFLCKACADYAEETSIVYLG